MGHYASEMMCEECGKVRCICKRLPPKPDKRWIVDNDFSVIQICDFDEKYKYVQTKYGPVDGMPMIRRLKWPAFETKQGAEAHARVLCEKHLKELEAEVKLVKKILKKLP